MLSAFSSRFSTTEWCATRPYVSRENRRPAALPASGAVPAASGGLPAVARGSLFLVPAVITDRVSQLSCERLWFVLVGRFSLVGIRRGRPVDTHLVTTNLEHPSPYRALDAWSVRDRVGGERLSD